MEAAPGRAGSSWARRSRRRAAAWRQAAAPIRFSLPRGVGGTAGGELGWVGVEVGDGSGRPRVSRRRRRWLIRDEWSRCDGERGWGLRGLVFRDSFGLWCGLPLPALLSLRVAASQQLRAPHVLSRGRFRVPSCSSNTGLVDECDSFSTPVRCQREQRKSLSMPPPPFFLSRKIHCHR